VFDADERVDPKFLPAAVGKLDAADVVQGRTVPEPTGIVESVAYYESLVLDEVARRFLYLLTDFRMAASRAVVMDRAAFRESGGYHTEMLTEDFEFAYRCYRNGLTVTELLTYPSKIEAAHSLPDWWGQRKRWMTGYAQVLHKLLATIRPLTDYRNPTSAVICAGTAVGSLLMLTMLPKFAVLFLAGANTLSVLPFAAAIFATGTVRLHDWRSGAVDRLGWAWTVVPVVFPLYSLTAIKAVLEYVFAADTGWYHVRKGE
jgi:cellulose synthase/poly-beta-1,6-N-acetylglucosamine synthase-like glycosyltransferase